MGTKTLGRQWLRTPSAALALILALLFGVFSSKRLAAYNDEMELWRQVLRYQPDNYMACDNLGHLFVLSGRFPDAIKELQRPLPGARHQSSGFNDLGMCFDHSGRYPEAIEALNQALRLNPDYTDALLNLASSLQQGRLPEAREKLERALRLNPDSAEVQNNMGVPANSSNQISQRRELPPGNSAQSTTCPCTYQFGKTLYHGRQSKQFTSWN